MNWFHSVLLGFVSGLCELLPLSAAANRGLLRQLLGIEAEGPLFTLLCRAAVLTVLLASGLLELRRLRRTARILRMPYRRRTGHPSLNESGTLRLLKVAVPLALVAGILSARLADLADKLWLVPIPLVLGGVLLWLPGVMRSANKDGRHLSGLDGLLMGLGILAGAVPGISPVGAVFAIAAMRGAQRRYALRFASTMLAVSLAASMVMDLLSVVVTGFTFDAAQLLSAGLGFLSAGLAAYLAVHAMRTMIRPGGHGIYGFCYYNWGQALLSLVLFLMV